MKTPAPISIKRVKTKLVRGFTLIELVMVMVLVGILAGIGVPMLMQTVDAWSFNSQFQDNSVFSAIVAMNRMSREIRRLKDDASVTAATASQFSFDDINSNAITFDLSGNTLMRNTDGLSDYVSSLSFTYYDDNDAVIAVPIISPNTNIRRIQADLNVFSGSNTLDFQFSIRPQNLRRLNEKFK
ncbi:MAG: type II secretion system protein [Candidatus Omnitrophota bacterium]